MKILMIASPFSRVSRENYESSGGLIASLLVDELTARGHEVTLFATEDSKTKGKLDFLYEQSVGEPVYENWCHEMLHLEEALADIDSFDVVHNHTQSGLIYAHILDAPIIHTIHSVKVYANEADLALLRYLPGRSLVNVSEHQRGILAHPQETNVIHNAIDTQAFPLFKEKANYLLFVGRICESKAPHIAIEVAKRTGHNLILAGAVSSYDRRYFQNHILPHIDNNQIHYVGAVSGMRKTLLYQKAKALLFPVLWDEPFGLVMIEALSCGTPVIASDRGAVQEIIEHQVNGFIVDNIDDMCGAVSQVGQLEAERCHEFVSQKFNIQKMVSAYEQAYEYTSVRLGRKAYAA